MIPQRKKRNTGKVNLIISVIFHSVLIFAVFYFAAREGMLGKKLKQLTVTMVPKEKKPEPPKEKPPEPKIEPPKPTETPKVAVNTPKLDTPAAPPPPTGNSGAPAAAPAPAELAAFNFSDGAKTVDTIADANGVYKALVEHSLRSRWNRPEDMADENFVAEAELSVTSKGQVTGYRWLSGSGNARWDASVKAVLDQTKTISREPPKGFPAKFTVRFDVESQRSEPLFGASNLR